MGQIAFWKIEKQERDGAYSVVNNHLSVSFPAIAQNEQLARMLVSAFVAPLNPTLEELNDVKTAVSEAVTNAIIHGYPKRSGQESIRLEMENEGMLLKICVKDDGIGISDVALAMQPLYTSKPELERSGMGFAFMEAFMTTLQVTSQKGEGVQIYMEKEFGREEVDD